MNVAGRFGLADLAIDVLQILRKRVNVPLVEHHISPTIQAFVISRRYKDAFAVLCMLDTSRISHSTATASPIYQALKENPEDFDVAITALEELYTEGTKLSTACVNTIIQASIASGDMQRATFAYSIIKGLDLRPTVETFNFLLEGAVAARSRPLGTQFLLDMKTASISPNGESYNLMITLFLYPSADGTGDYEDAFFYLEEAKAQGFVPSKQVYENIIRRCYFNRDTRHQLAIDEMQEMGYQMSLGLKKQLGLSPPSKNGTREKIAEESPESDRAPDV